MSLEGAGVVGAAEIAWLQGGGETGALIRAHDWAGTPLGQARDWSRTLKTLVAVILGASRPMFVAWGPRRTLIYNDPYRIVLAGKHPALGRDFLAVWDEIRADLEPLVARAYAGEPSHMDDIRLVMLRKGYAEETHWSFSYTPVRDEDGEVGGFLCACDETTGQVHAEAALRESEARYRTLFESIDQGFYRVQAIFDEAGACVDARYLDENPAAVRITGRPFRGRTLGELGYADPFWRALFGRVARTGVAERFERHDPALDRWFELHAFRPVDAGPDEAAVVFRDVSAKKRREATLVENEERLRLATDAAEVGFWDVDEVDQRLLWPPRVKAMFGISADVPVSMADFYQGLHPEDADAVGAAYAAAADPARRALYDVEYRTVGKEDGVVRWVAAKGRGVFDPAGRCVRVIGVAIDITARKAVEQRLRELNETLEQRVAAALAERKLLADLVEGTDAFVQVADPDFRWLAINRAAADEFERIFGKRPKVGDSMLEMLADLPEHRAAVAAVWGRALVGEEFTETGEFGDPGRDRRCYEMKYNALRDADGRQIGAYQFVYDVTDRVAEQRRLAEAEEALRQSRKMEAMGQLTGGVAHDFNNLLTPIVGSLDMLQRQGLGGEREQRLIAGAAQSAERARTLVQRLLAFARRQPLQPVAVDIARLVSGMGDLIASTTGPQIRVTVDAPADLPPALADPNQLEMALLNLSVNARDAMPDGGALRISATAERIGPVARAGLLAGEYIRLSVADTGAGMDEATIARAVEPFFSTKGIGQGTGLGLSMVHGLAQQLGGALTIQSRPGVGTNMELWLPQTTTRPDADPATPEAAAASPGRGVALLVDDEELVRMSTADMLADLGWEVLEAASAEDALRQVAAGARFDLLVTDHLMPGMNGADLAREVRALRPAVPALLVSGYAEGDGIAADLPRLVKPFRRDELATSIAGLVAAER